MDKPPDREYIFTAAEVEEMGKDGLEALRLALANQAKEQHT